MCVRIYSESWMAYQAAAELQRGEDMGWKYTVVYHGAGFAILITDEEGEEVGFWK